MGKLLKNIHWFIIAYAVFEFYSLYGAAEETYSNLQIQHDSQKVELAKNKRVKRDITNYYKNIEEEKLKIERVAQEIERMQQLLPSDLSDIDNINLLRTMASDVNIRELSIVPEVEMDRGFYMARKYRVKAKATFLQFLIFFEKIAENKRILNIGECVFTKSEQVQRSKFQIIEGDVVIESYRYNANYKEDRGIDEIEEKFKGEKPVVAPRAKEGKGEE